MFTKIAFTFIPRYLSRLSLVRDSREVLNALLNSNGGLTITLIPERDILLKIKAHQAFRYSKPKPCLRWDSTAWCGALEVREGMCSADTCFFRGSTQQRYLLHGADFKRSRNDKRTLNSNKHTSSRTLRLPYPFPSGIDVRGVRLGVRGKRRTRAYRG